MKFKSLLLALPLLLIANPAWTVTTGSLQAASIKKGAVTLSVGGTSGTIAITSGNVATASSLASNPTDCLSGTFAISIDAAGNLTCDEAGDFLSDGSVPMTGAIQAEEVTNVAFGDDLYVTTKSGGSTYSGDIYIQNGSTSGTRGGVYINANVASLTGTSGVALFGPTYYFDGLSSNKAAIIDGSGNLSTSATTSTELSYVGGASSNIQTQINSIKNFASHEYFVDATSGNNSNSGGPSAPFLTIQTALTAIGDAANSTAYNVAGNAYYVVHVAPGVYTENLTIPNRQYVEIDAPGVYIIGNMTYPVNGGLSVGAVSKPKLVLRGSDVRNMYAGSGYPLTGLSGDLNVTNTGVNQVVVDIDRFGIGGDAYFSTTPAAFSALLFLSETIIGGNIRSDFGTQVTLYAVATDTSSSKAIGGVNGQIILNVLRNVRFVGAVIGSGIGANARWFNTDFGTNGSNTLSGTTYSVVADANSVESFYNGFTAGANRGTTTFTLADTARGVGYTPTTSGDWASVPTTVLGALDFLAPKIVTTLAQTFTGVKTFTSPPSAPGATGARSENWGSGSSALADDSTAIGNGATVGNTGYNKSTAIGSGVTVAGDSATCIGYGSTCNQNSTAIGRGAAAGSGVHTLTLAAGYGASALYVRGMSVGGLSTSGADSAQSFGNSANCSHQASQCYGFSATSTAANQLVFGGTETRAIATSYFGSGVTSTAPLATFTLSTSGGSGTNIVGTSMIIQPGTGTGNSAVSSVTVKTPTVTTSGTSAQTQATRALFDSTGLAVTGNVNLTTAGNGFGVKEGTNARMGIATLVGGTVTVSTTAVTANSRVFLTAQTNSGTPGAVSVSARTGGTSFTITSTSGTDTSDVAWLIVEPQ